MREHAELLWRIGPFASLLKCDIAPRSMQNSKSILYCLYIQCNGHITMIHIDVVIAAEQSEKLTNALRVQLEECLSEFTPVIRVKTGAVSSLNVSGVKDDSEREAVMLMIQQIWEDDSWIPEEVKL